MVINMTITTDEYVSLSEAQEWAERMFYLFRLSPKFKVNGWRISSIRREDQAEVYRPQTDIGITITGEYDRNQSIN